MFTNRFAGAFEAAIRPAPQSSFAVCTFGASPHALMAQLAAQQEAYRQALAKAVEMHGIQARKDAIAAALRESTN
jgi:hypothetical protein